MTRWFSTEPARFAVRAVGISLGLALLTALIALPSHAESTTPAPVNPESASEITEAPPGLPLEIGFTSQAMMAEIEALFLSHEAHEKSLAARLAEMDPDEQQRIALESQIAAEQLMMDVLRVQARHAREAGHEDFALRIEVQIAEREKAQADPASRIELATQKDRQPSRIAHEGTPEQPAAAGTVGIGEEGGQR